MHGQLTAIALFASTLIGVATAQEEIRFKSTEVRDGLFMLEGVGGFTGGNLGLSVGEDGVFLIDDSMPPFSDKMLAAIAEATDQSVDFVLNTHVHGDHIGGNQVMTAQGATIVAHDNIRRRMVENGVQGQSGMVPAPADALPVITFAEAMSFHLNGHNARIIHVPHAHTDGDAFVHFRDIDLIHTGDLMFNGLFPFIDLDSGGSVDGYIAGQETILSLAGPDTKIIPGHGPLATRGDLKVSLAMLKAARSRIADLKAGGMSEDDVVNANPLANFHDDWNWGFITTERMTRQVYKGLP